MGDAMKIRTLLAALTLGVLTTGCISGGTDAEGTDTTNEAPVGDGAVEDGEGAGDAPDGDDVGDTAGDTAASGTPNVVSCEAASDDGVYFQVKYTNGSDSAQRITGDASLTLDNGEVTLKEAIVESILPGETIADSMFTSAPPDTTVTACSADGLVASPVQRFESGRDDLGACTVAEGEFGSVTFELPITNSAAATPASYFGHVAIRDGSGVRAITAPFLVGGFEDELAPGASIVHSGEALGGPFQAGYTCEVLTVEKTVDQEFFITDGEVAAGSLNADVGFATGSAELTEDARVLLQGPLREIVENHPGEICVEGYADSVGPDADNLALSQARAEAVAAHLTASGVTNPIEPVGFGESEATADEVDDPSLRRVDVILAACAG